MIPRSVCIVTGGNRGIGLETVKGLLNNGRYHVVFTSRDASVGETVINEVIYNKQHNDGRRGGNGGDHGIFPLSCIDLDVSNKDSCTTLPQRLIQKGLISRNHNSIGSIINNAGIYVDGFSNEIYRSQLQTNFYGPIRVFHALRPYLSKNAKIINVSSGYGNKSKQPHPPDIANLIWSAANEAELIDIGENLFDTLNKMSSGGKYQSEDYEYPCYKMTKCLLNKWSDLMMMPPSSTITTGDANDHHQQLVAKESEKATNSDQKETKQKHQQDFEYKVSVVDPGWCSTDLGGPDAYRTPKQGADSVLFALFNEDDSGSKESGIAKKYYNYEGKIIDW